MSYGDGTPIRDELLERVKPLIDKLKGQLVVLGYDVQLQTWPTPPPKNTLINTYCLVVLANGALVGEENRLSYVWSFGQTPQIPNDTQLEEAVRQTFQRLSLMKLRQLQQAEPGNSAN